MVDLPTAPTVLVPVGGVLGWLLTRFERTIRSLRKADQDNKDEIDALRLQMQAKNEESERKYFTREDFRNHQEFIRDQFNHMNSRLDGVGTRLDGVFSMITRLNDRS